MERNLHKQHAVGDVVNLGNNAYRIVSEDLSRSLDSLPGGRGIRPVKLELFKAGNVTTQEAEDARLLPPA